MSRESLEHLRDYILLTLSPMDINWLMNELGSKLQQQEQQKPNTMDEINAMIDESERQIANGEYYSNEQVMDMLAGELGLSDEEYLAASKQRWNRLQELEQAYKLARIVKRSMKQVESEPALTAEETFSVLRAL